MISDVIEGHPTNAAQMSHIGQLFWARHVMCYLTVTQLKAKYQHSILGFFWSLTNPLLTMAVYVFVFSEIFKVDMEFFAIYLLSGMLTYQFFSGSVLTSTMSLVSSENYYKNYYVPKTVFPLVSVAVAGFEFCSSLLVLLGLCWILGPGPKISVLFVPISIILIIMFTVGCSFISAILGSYFRDFRHIVGVGLQLWFFATPIVYPVSMIPESLRGIIILNPLYYFISDFNFPIYYGACPPIDVFAVSVVLSFVTLLFGWLIFMKYEGRLVFCR